MSKEIHPTTFRAFQASGQFEGVTAICPHCGAVSTFQHFFRQNAAAIPVRVPPADGLLGVLHGGICPGCRGLVIGCSVNRFGNQGIAYRYVWPPAMPPDNCPDSASEAIRIPYNEARRVLDVSPSASAVLVRRALQMMIREKLGIKKRSLNDEIEAAIKGDELSKIARQGLHQIREYGNWAAHPTRKSVKEDADFDDAALWVEVTRSEAEYCLRALERAMHDLYHAPDEIAGIDEAIKEKKASEKK
ncbi:MAG: DUF4145 domain-containing protein [Planctomycetes bacterium]|nr:DUF4145 domain-containing protein [Planctomycetota bacterium]